jgi:DNA adenine methylase
MMATDYPHYLVADINPDLINLYQVIKFDANNSSNAKDLFASTNNSEVLLQIRQV